MERILWQTGEAYGLCDGVAHVLVTNDGAEWKQGACDCTDSLNLRLEADSSPEQVRKESH